MKSVLLILLLCGSVEAGDFRLVGTNLYDFSGAGPNSCYRVRGRISKVYPQSTEISTAHLYYQRYVFPAPAASALAMSILGPNDVLAMKAGDPQAIERGVTVARAINVLPHEAPPLVFITPDQYSYLDTAMKNNFRPVTVWATNYLLHYSNPHLGKGVDCLAIPTKYRGFYDCGIPFEGDTNRFKIIFRVMPNRIVARTNLSSVFFTASTNISRTVVNP